MTQELVDTGVDDPKLREFLYLDFPKLTSYLAQSLEGLVRLQQSIIGRQEQDKTTDAEYEASFQGGVGGEVGNSDDPVAVLTKLLGAVIKMDSKISRLIRTGGDEKSLSDSNYLIETKELHHEVYSFIERMLERKGLVSKDADLDENKPFHIMSGPADFVDFNQLHDSIKNFKNTGKTFAAFTGEDPSKNVANLQNIATMVKLFYEDKLAIVVHNDDKCATANLQPELLTSPIEFIMSSFGRFTQVDVTVFGLKIGKSYPEEETTGQTAFRAGEDKAPEPKGLGQMANSLLNANRGLEGMDRFFRIRGDVHLYPLAVFIDFER